MYSVAPALDLPALLAATAALLQVCELPQVVDSVKVTNLDKPGTDTFHDLTAGLKASSPMCLPLEQVARVQCVGAQFKDAAQGSWRCCWPERELLHKRNVLGVDQALQFVVELRELRVVGDVVSRLVVTLVLLVFPNVDCCNCQQQKGLMK